MRTTTSRIGLVTLAVASCWGAAARAQVVIEWTTVGNAGNAPDPLNSPAIPGIGSVGYTYRIGAYEVTNAQYAAFLSAAAATDPNGLYSTFMDSNARGGIVRSGPDGSYTYATKANMGDKPVNYVSSYDIARFCNWMTNGQPSGGSGTESGVYTFVAADWISAITRDLNNPNQVFIPTENEWYKAAYHQPAAQGGDSDNYWLYATQSNSVPTVATATPTGDIANPGAGVANYSLGADWNGQNGNVTTVGSAGNRSFYGAFDMNGNIYEWNETPADGAGRLRGGSWSEIELILRSSFEFSVNPAGEGLQVGFRVASPAPACAADWDGSGGQPNSSDFLAYLNDYSAQNAAADLAPPGGDGSFDSSDFLAFLNLYAQGC